MRWRIEERNDMMDLTILGELIVDKRNDMVLYLLTPC